MSNIFSAEQILGAQDIDYVEVSVPEWGDGVVRLKALSADEMIAHMSSMRNRDGSLKLEGIHANLVCKCLVDENGNRLFKDSQARKLGEKNAAVMTRLYNEAMKLNGQSDDDIEEIEEEIAENPTGA